VVSEKSNLTRMGVQQALEACLGVSWGCSSPRKFLSPSLATTKALASVAPYHTARRERFWHPTLNRHYVRLSAYRKSSRVVTGSSYQLTSEAFTSVLKAQGVSFSMDGGAIG